KSIHRETGGTGEAGARLPAIWNGGAGCRDSQGTLAYVGAAWRATEFSGSSAGAIPHDRWKTVPLHRYSLQHRRSEEKRCYGTRWTTTRNNRRGHVLDRQGSHGDP